MELIEVKDGAYFRLVNSYLKNSNDDCVALLGLSYYSIISHSRIEDCERYGLFVDDDGATTGPNASMLLNTVVGAGSETTDSLVHIAIAANITIIGGELQGANLAAHALEIGDVNRVVVQGVWMENSTTTCVRAIDAAPGVRNAVFVGNHCSNGTGSQMYDFSGTATHQNIQIVNNRFQGVDGTKTVFDPGATLTFEFAMNLFDGSTPAAYVGGEATTVDTVYDRSTQTTVLKTATRIDAIFYVGDDTVNSLSDDGTNHLVIHSNNAAGDIRMQVDGTTQLTIDADGPVLRSYGFASLPAAPDYTIVGCTDCTPNSSPCSGAGTGAIAKRLNGGWDCR